MRVVFTHDKNQFWANPNTSQKRLGDGAYEQKLIREQVALLTGKRFLVSCPSVRNSFFAEFQPHFFSMTRLIGLVFDGVVALVGAALCLLFMQFQVHAQALPLPDADSAI
jgi:hypothetical protein